MQVLQWLRTKWMRTICFALFLCLIPASSRAGVFISVGIAPPPLPVVAVQPVCPQPGYMWTPGYWAYGDDGYYWVPGTWVPAPEPGLLWTPGYWGWGGGLYAWHPGYWGPHVGYYGGVNYGFGFFGVGFVGGMWHGGVFAYNSAVWHVGAGPAWGGNRVYVDRTVIVNHTVVNNHIAFNGGPGGIHHDPAPEERAAMNEHHFAPSGVQSQHEMAARNDHSAYFNNNHGNPSHVTMARPMGGNAQGANPQFIQRGNQNIHQAPSGGQFNNGQQHGQQSGQWNRNNTGGNNGMGQRGNNPPPPQPQHQPQPQQHQWQQPQQHNNPQPHPQPQPQQHNNSQPHEDHGGGGHDHGH